MTRIQGGKQSRLLTGLPSLAVDGRDASGPSDVSFLRRLGFLTVGPGADPADRAELVDSNPQAVQAGSRRAAVADIGRDSLIRAVLGANTAVGSQLLPSGRTLGQLWTFAAGVPHAVPLADVAGYEESAKP